MCGFLFSFVCSVFVCVVLVCYVLVVCVVSIRFLYVFCLCRVFLCFCV